LQILLQIADLTGSGANGQSNEEQKSYNFEKESIFLSLFPLEISISSWNVILKR
jgi:hypothetical protein